VPQAPRITVVIATMADRISFTEKRINDFAGESAVDRELVLRLASLLWRLRRATTMKAGNAGRP